MVIAADQDSRPPDARFIYIPCNELRHASESRCYEYFEELITGTKRRVFLFKLTKVRSS